MRNYCTFPVLTFVRDIHKNNGIVKWNKGLHETIIGSTNTKGLDATPDMSLWHIKSVEKQEYQDIFYKTL